MKMRFIAFIIFAFLLPGTAHAALTDNLVSYWKFDEASGNATDSSGGGKTLTNVNTAAYTTAKINNGADLERNTSQHFSTSNSGAYDVTAGTINLWIRLESSTGSGVFTIFSTSQGGGLGGLEFRVDDNDRLDVYFGEGAAIETNGVTTLSTGTWYMVTLTWTTSGRNLYVNAVNDATDDTDRTMEAGTATAYIGRRHGTAENFDGVIDEMGFWSRALSGAEITQLYNAGNGLAYPFAAAGGSADDTYFEVLES
jgi:hypothetical protein